MRWKLQRRGTGVLSPGDDVLKVFITQVNSCLASDGSPRHCSSCGEGECCDRVWSHAIVKLSVYIHLQLSYALHNARSAHIYTLFTAYIHAPAKPLPLSSMHYVGLGTRPM